MTRRDAYKMLPDYSSGDIIDEIFDYFENKSKNIVSVYIKTESGDNYHYMFNIDSTEELIYELKETLDNEFGWIAEISINDSMSSVKIDIQQIYNEVYRLVEEI